MLGKIQIPQGGVGVASSMHVAWHKIIPGIPTIIIIISVTLAPKELAMGGGGIGSPERSRTGPLT